MGPCTLEETQMWKTPPGKLCTENDLQMLGKTHIEVLVPKFGVKSQSGRKNIPNALHLEPYSINQRLTTISILVFDHRKQLVVVDVPRDIDPILYGE